MNSHLVTTTTIRLRSHCEMIVCFIIDFTGWIRLQLRAQRKNFFSRISLRCLWNDEKERKKWSLGLVFIKMCILLLPNLLSLFRSWTTDTHLYIIDCRAILYSWVIWWLYQHFYLTMWMNFEIKALLICICRKIWDFHESVNPLKNVVNFLSLYRIR